MRFRAVVLVSSFVASPLLLAACGIISGVTDYAIIDDPPTSAFEDGAAAAAFFDRTEPERSDAAEPIPPDPTRDAASNGDGGLSLDAALEAEAGPFTSDPTKIACNGQICTTGVTRCCYASTTNIQCLGGGTNCAGSEINCDERADCVGGGQYCCLEQDLGGPAPSTYCKADCNENGKRARVCKNDQECGGAPCKLILCKGRPIGTCGGRIPDICD